MLKSKRLDFKNNLIRIIGEFKITLKSGRQSNQAIGSYFECIYIVDHGKNIINAAGWKGAVDETIIVT